MHEQRWQENVKTLRKFVNEEAEFQVAATETLNGLQRSGQRSNQGGSSFFGDKGDTRQKKVCKVCKAHHRLWECDEFKKKDAVKRWEVVKKNRLCFRCLNANHFAKDCRSSRICGVDGCTDNHNRLLHQAKESVSPTPPATTTEKEHGGGDSS